MSGKTYDILHLYFNKCVYLSDEVKIYIGVADDGKITGISHPENVRLQVINAIRDGIKPDMTIFTKCKIKNEEGKNIIVISLTRGTDRPYYLSDKGIKPSGVYVRHATASIPASEEAIRRMIKESDGDRFENTRAINQELNFDFTIKEFAARNIDFGDSQMITLGIKNSDGLFSNLGLLLSEQCMHTIKFACFEGDDKNVFKDRQEFGGSLLRQLHESFEFINLHNRLQAKISGLERTEYRDYPEVAIREALLNALVHRDYSYSGSTLINIFHDHIEFISLGGPVSGLTVDDIMLGISQTRNEKLTNIFYRLKLIEAYGTGISKIMNNYRDISIKPEIKATSSAFMITLPSMYSGKSFTPAVDHPNNPQWDKVINFITPKKEISRLEVQELLEVSTTRANVILRQMAEKGLIKIIGLGKNRKYAAILNKNTSNK
ncbi:MAG: ATP-binding protein [Candidatus Wallbacteria bacterium]